MWCACDRSGVYGGCDLRSVCGVHVTGLVCVICVVCM